MTDEEIAARVNAFGCLLEAALMDAAVERKMTQFKTEITPPGHRTTQVRIIIVPESMDAEAPKGFRK